MQSISATAVFWTIVFLTIGCGCGAGAIAVYTANNGPSANMDQLFGTLSHLFSGGIGAIFGFQATKVIRAPR